ncbi:MAG: DUF3098 domain-containing protein [Alistipes sp.]|nr:DUF3098 domain-containing protein [Alistipes sp.]
MNKDVNKEQMPFTMKNYITILVGVVLLLVGFVLMSGGGEHTATEFDYSIFSFRRITLAPIVVIAGFVVVGFGIMKRFKNE